MSVNKNQEDGLPVSEGAARSAMITGVKSGSFGVVARASSQLGTLIVTLFSTRMLAIEEFGAFAIASALMVLSRNTFYVGSYEFLLKSQPVPDRVVPRDKRPVRVAVIRLPRGLRACFARHVRNGARSDAHPVARPVCFPGHGHCVV
jgi:hypothetical protein